MTETTSNGTMRSELSTVRELLTNPRVRIPEYQRPYSWTTDHIGQLVEDVRRFRTYGAYRIGTVIFHENNRTDSVDADVAAAWSLDIVDGQQRYLSFGIIAFELSAFLTDRESKLAADLRQAAAGITLPDRRDGRSSVNLRRNAAHVKATVDEWSNAEREEFARFFLDDCTMVSLTVTDLDSAFQMFDSQNTRGRELYPTDLLKAYHLREYTRSAASHDEVLSTVRKWESVQPEEINHLFGHLLFPILKWSAGHKVPARGFSAAEINAFKGIREERTGQGRFRWAQPVLMAKAYVDEFAARNRILIDHGVLKSLEFPFQLTLPVIDGEMFFRMVAHYVQLTRELGISSSSVELTERHDDDRRRHNPRLHDVISRTREAGDGAGDVYVRELFGCLLLAYADRFGNNDVTNAAGRLARHAYLLRIALQRVQRGSMENHALGVHPRLPTSAQTNLFAFLAHALDPVSLLRLPAARVEDIHTINKVTDAVAAIFGMGPRDVSPSGVATTVAERIYEESGS